MFPIKDNLPTRRFPVLTVLLIVACTIIYFAFEQGGIGLGPVGNERVIEWGAIPYEITHPGKECVEPPPGTRIAALAERAGTPLVCEGQELRLTTAFGGEAVVKLPDRFPAELTRGDPPTWLTLFSSMFLHGGLLHLAGNMLFLWIFGNNVEDSMGRLRFIAFYLLGGLAALVAQVAFDPSAAVPTVGASGAIAAVLGGYALLYPRARVITVVFVLFFFTIVELPALLVLGMWFLVQLFYGAAELGQPLGGSGGVAYFAHIGGFLFGLLAIKAFANRPNREYDASYAYW
ncbi:rhomboid family intramembrane serine protease [Thermoleophilum album]|uniref:Rhomboid family protein n=1 Tax=Thermoleophilum album TaxID=29539 RepID=A0A1H6FLB6_THEAL|nr:rhomboid family intramembrane serine protease [Thermoleophilum album]SEH10928.1 Rhomboid family protein [Thermoleophilum album]